LAVRPVVAGGQHYSVGQQLGGYLHLAGQCDHRFQARLLRQGSNGLGLETITSNSILIGGGLAHRTAAAVDLPDATIAADRTVIEPPGRAIFPGHDGPRPMCYGGKNAPLTNPGRCLFP
jgi:hypothetical protein